MQLGLVVGNVTSTKKHPSLHGWKLLVVQPMLADGTKPDGDPVLAIDNASLLSVNLAGSASACKNNGWQAVTRADGSMFNNQGDCIQYVNTGK